MKKSDEEKAKVNSEPVSKGSETPEDVNALSRQLQIKPEILAGVMEAEGWRDEKAACKEEFKRAVTDFLSARAG